MGRKLRRIRSVARPPKRPADSHKGTYGRVLVVAGSRGMTGAAVLAVRGALRAGAGLVHLCAPESVAGPLAAQLVCSVLNPTKCCRPTL